MRKPFRRLLGCMAALLMAAFGYLLVILADPQDPASPVLPRMDQPLLTASAAVLAQSVDQLPLVLSSFPVPVLAPLSGSGWTLINAISADAAFENGLGRVVTLSCTDASGHEVIIRSIYPARALSLVEKGDFTLSGTAGQTLAGVTSVRMENETHIRLHAQAEEAIYVLEVPRMTAKELIALTRSLQLVEGK